MGARRQMGAFVGLQGVQLFLLFSGLVTAPLIAHSLGPERRGLLAAIAVPLGVGAFIFELGLGPYAIRSLGQGRRANLVFGSLAVPTIVIGIIVAAASPFIAEGLAPGHHLVQLFLVIGFMLMPLTLLSSLAMNLANGLSLWRALVVARLVSPLTVAVGIVVLFLSGTLTLQTAAAVTVVSGVLPILALGPVLRRTWPAALDLRLARSGLAFGAKATAGVAATMANQRLDQILMIPLVPARQLGLYTVAATMASLSTVMSSQIITVALPRIAAGEVRLMAQATRYALLATVLTGVGIAFGAWLLLVPVFGSGFADSRALVYVLLLGWIAQSGLSTLSQGLPAVGRPGAPSIGEAISLGITVPGLILLLPVMGAMGAALLSLVAYAVTFVILLAITSRHLGDRAIDYIVPRRADIGTLRRMATSWSIAGRLRPRQPMAAPE